MIERKTEAEKSKPFHFSSVGTCVCTHALEYVNLVNIIDGFVPLLSVPKLCRGLRALGSAATENVALAFPLFYSSLFSSIMSSMPINSRQEKHHMSSMPGRILHTYHFFVPLGLDLRQLRRCHLV